MAQGAAGFMVSSNASTKVDNVATVGVPPAAFVRLDTASGKGHQILQASASTHVIIGVTQEGGRRAPGIGLSVGNEQLAGTSGEVVGVFQAGEECLLYAAATIATGDLLTAAAADTGWPSTANKWPDGAGTPVTLGTGTTVTQIGAIALTSASAGEKVRVLVRPYSTQI